MSNNDIFYKKIKIGKLFYFSLSKHEKYFKKNQIKKCKNLILSNANIEFFNSNGLVRLFK